VSAERLRHVLVTVVCALLLASCAGRGLPGAARPPSPTEAPVFNLSGYSASYKKGHGDACAQRRDERLYSARGDYMMGWNDGVVACKGR